MIVVHHLENSRSQRIVWLLEELAVDYELRSYQRDPDTMLAPASLKQVHPLGKSPVITDGEHTVVESGAIIEYLVTRHGGQWLVPAVDTPQWIRYQHWMHYAEGSAMPPLLIRRIMSRLGDKPVPAILRPAGKLLEQGVRQKFLDPQIRTHLDYWETELGRHEWFAGEVFTAADIQMSFPLIACDKGGELSRRPNARRFLEQVRSRPAYQRTVSKIGEFDL